MDDDTLLKSALVIGIIGLVTLFFLSKTIEIKELKIEEINEKNIGEKVKIRGIIKKFTPKENVNFIEFENSKILIVYFDEINLNKGDLIEVVGGVELYKGKLEIVAEEIVTFEPRLSSSPQR